ncbi:MAG: hydrogenase iron-sulfur subunit [Dehalococcoidia bacterium]|nr:hydrogenase iron-sulfur subunit [Dehalococcoidia bacterium]
MPDRIVVFTCNWDGWSCIDAASSGGMKYPASVSIIKLTCLSSLNAGSMLKAFELGADGVLLLGCLQQQCRYGQFSGNIEVEITKARDILNLLGARSGKIKLSKLAAFDGKGFVEQLQAFINELTGPTLPVKIQTSIEKIQMTERKIIKG